MVQRARPDATTLSKSVVVNLLFMNGGEVAAVHKDKQPSQQRCFELLCSFGKEIGDKAESGKHQ